MARRSYAKKPAAPKPKKVQPDYDAYVCQRNKAFMVISTLVMDPPLALGQDVHDGWSIKAGPFRNGWEAAGEEMKKFWREINEPE